MLSFFNSDQYGAVADDGVGNTFTFIVVNLYLICWLQKYAFFFNFPNNQSIIINFLKLRKLKDISQSISAP